MRKSDKSIHRICIAKIKRSTMKPYDFKWSIFYENDSRGLFQNYPFELHDDELIICSSIIDSSNFSILTTRKLITNENGTLHFGSLINAKNRLYGDFKSKDEDFTFGKVELESGEILKYFIETRRASMIMVQGIKTAIDIQVITEAQVEKVANIWNNKVNKRFNND
ncbi:hypothetical protein J3D55_000904 [Chryseobacterium ginsenosidimutans]|uniref:hypothetical protein n=1 Tax=Chryseobacterium ginsenosidimutans TaxID=687846 RepID=UPI0021671D8A|nr:hypothetical protein [Chryseobacterium ginsenosidimutans]MCS3867988.1 hypothetical protein [Chryseobacterium ginsenosidimutans]